MMNLKPRIFSVFFLFAIIVFTIGEANASRRHMPMGYYIREAELIVIGDTKKGENMLDLIVSVNEVVKGDAELVGQDITISTGRIMSTADAWVPPDTKQVAILFPPNWRQSERWPVLEAYKEPHELDALRILVKILDIENERKRLNELEKVFFDGNPSIQEQFFTELSAMRNRDNFDILIELYEKLDETHQEKLIKQIDGMCDLRGVPTLIKALSSSSKAVRVAAVHGLYYNLPGASGVAEAFEKHLETDGINWYASRYLAKRFKNEKYQELSKPKETRWLKASQLEEEGKIKEAREIYYELVADNSEDDYSRRTTALKLVKDANEEELAIIRKAILPLLKSDVKGDNYIWTHEAARILRALHHPDCLPALLKLLEHNEGIQEKSVQQATMAIRELGVDARQRAVEKIKEMLQTAPPKHPTGDNPERYLLELVWLGNEKQILETKDILHTTYQRFWEYTKPLIPLNNTEDEVLLLIDLLNGPIKDSYREIRHWVVFRLGDLRDERAIPVLVNYLKSVNNMHYYGEEALKNISGERVEQAMIELLLDEEQRVRGVATEVLLNLQGKRSLSILRRMVKEENFGDRQSAFIHLGHHGTLEDLEMLKPFCDFWNRGNNSIYWPCQAMVGIRERFDYDINGLIKKVVGTPSNEKDEFE